MKVVLASNNAGKIREFKALLKNFDIELIPQAELSVSDIEETGLSFIENALIKARHASRVTGLPALSDDSGLVVSILNGEPGIYSARYAGKEASAEKNIEKLLLALKDVPDEKRDAHFHCVLAFISHALDPTPLICEGKWTGKILHATKGHTGFGYDPIFYDPIQKQTAAEMELTIKNAISHRGLALQTLLKLLPEKL